MQETFFRVLITELRVAANGMLRAVCRDPIREMRTACRTPSSQALLQGAGVESAAPGLLRHIPYC